MRGLGGEFAVGGWAKRSPSRLSLIAAGESEEARKPVEELDPISAADMDLAMWVAEMHAKLGDKDRAFRLLARATELGNDQLDVYEDAKRFGRWFGAPRRQPFIEGVRARVAEYKRESGGPPSDRTSCTLAGPAGGA